MPSVSTSGLSVAKAGTGLRPPDRVQVVCRVRPPEKDHDNCVVVTNGDGGDIVTLEGAQRPFNVTKAFGSDSTQQDMFDFVGLPSLSYVMQGYGACIFAYGQTGSGKTFTMTGTNSAPGLIPRIIRELFLHLVEGYKDFTVNCQYVEIYMEKARDLFNPSRAKNPWDAPGPKINVRYDGKRVKLENAKCLSYGNEALASENADTGVALAESLSKRLLRSIEDAGRHRAVRGHALNAESSRSHAVLTLEITARRPDADIVSTLMLVDLAGSENIGKAQVEGTGAEEAKSINKSLSILSRCIEALAAGSKVPFRESVLTKILTPALDGRSCCTLVAALRGDHASETGQTLKFTETALKVTVRPKQTSSEALGVVQEQARDLRGEITALKQELDWLRQSEADSEALQGMIAAKEADLRTKMDLLTSLQQEIRDTEEQLLALRRELDGSKVEVEQERAGRCRAEAENQLLQARLAEAESLSSLKTPSSSPAYEEARLRMEQTRMDIQPGLQMRTRLAAVVLEMPPPTAATRHIARTNQACCVASFFALP
ncbi:unnamed protein product [Polarella glacialis]|uniref:Kinesin-like protein n=1 Tax=Polarella glacialis TaxID=89957 RepID=A0A813D4X0_POLGL|nr:unnamed protein product [Polarella glacialis]